MTIKAGIHIGSDKGFHKPILKTLEAMPLMRSCQIFVYSPLRIIKINYDKKELLKVIKDKKINLYVHSSYLISPWGKKPYNVPFCLKQLKDAADINAIGVIFHIPKQPALKLVPRLLNIVQKKPKNIKILLENRAAIPSDDTHETCAKLNTFIDILLDAGLKFNDVQIVIDTAHLFSCGTVLSSYKDAKAWLDDLKYPKAIRAFHLNGSQSTGYNDIHAIPFSSKDLIWGKTKFKDSGFKAFLEFSKKHKCDVIFELPYHDGGSVYEKRNKQKIEELVDMTSKF
jgi:endonuclease IV